MPQAAPPTLPADQLIDRSEDDNALNSNAEDRLPPSRQTTRPQQDQLSDDDYDRQAENVVIQRSPQDEARNAIISRFKHTSREEDERPFNGDMSDAENIYGDHGRQPDDEEDIDDDASVVGQRQPLQQPDPEQQPVAKKKVTVRGRVVEMTDDEILAAAQKTLAGDSYLEDAKAILAEAKRIKAGRAAGDSQHPEDHEDAPMLDDDDTDADAQHPEPTFRDVISKIQYGDPEEAAAELERLVDARATKQVSETHVQRLFDQDLARSQKALKKFSDDNPDIAGDEIAAMAIERGMYKLYREDILKLGMPEDRIPKNTAELANWHRWYRTHGHEVRSTTDLLNASKAQFLAWRDGRSTETRQPSREQPRREKPRVQINVDRDTRRAAIPNQPTRTVTPQRQAAPPVATTRSDVVANMRRARGQV